MLAKAITWFQELPLLKKLIGAAVALCVLAALAGWKWGVWAALGILGIGGLIGLALVGLNYFLKSRARRRGAEFGSALVGDIKKAKAEIGEQFDRAIRELKTSGIDVYQLPWYFYVGEPQSGKSFTIRSSGLNFPVGTEGLSGAGGTRNCDFWFTNEAVILDTAGRLLIQSDEVVDREQWTQVLRFLSRYRPNCPINGVLLGIPCTSLLEEDARTREEKAEIIRKRLKELQDALNVRFPIFLVLLKSDLVLGFDSFFKRLPVLERKQLFGWSNEARFDQPFDPARFDQAFEGIYQDLCRWRLKFLNDESLPENADQFYVFPEEFRALRVPILDYLNKIFIRGPYGQPGFFRGFYFTSSLQEGRAIPHAIQSILGGIEDMLKRPVGDLKEIQARSSPFFIRDLYARKVFSEKGLILRTDRSRLVNALVRGAALWGGGALVALGLFLMVLGYFQLGKALGPSKTLVEQIGSGDFARHETKFLDFPRRLSSEISKLDRHDRSFPGRIYRMFFPSPEGDVAFVGQLKDVYNHDFNGRYLKPFCVGVLGALKRPVADGKGGWEEFEARSRCLLALASIGTGAGTRDDLGVLVNYYKERGNPSGRTGENDPFTNPEYGTELVNQWHSFLSYKGNPLAEVGSEVFWKDFEESAGSLEKYLAAVLDAGKPGDDPSDHQYWWRQLLEKCQKAQSGYESLIAIRSAGPGDPATYVSQVKKPWLDAFVIYDRAWKDLEGHIGTGPGSSLDSGFEEQVRDITNHYQAIIDVLARSQDPKAREMKEKIEKWKRDALQKQATFKGEFQGALGKFAHLAAIPEPPPAGQPPVAATAPAISKAAGEIHRKLSSLNQILATGIPREVVAAESARTFPDALKNLVEKCIGDVFTKAPQGESYTLELPAAGADASWLPEKLRESILLTFRAALTSIVRDALDSHLKAAESIAEGGGAPAIDGWFSEGLAPIAAGTTLFAKELMPSTKYRQECHTSLQAHLSKLIDLVKKYCAPTLEYSLLFGDGGKGFTDRLERALLGYQTRYLNHWKDVLDKVELVPPDAANTVKDWSDFRSGLVDGFGRRSYQNMLSYLSTTIQKSRQALLPMVATPELKAANRWAAGLEFYSQEEWDSNLYGQLDNFGKFVINELKSDSIPTLMANVRVNREWLPGFPKTIRDKQKTIPGGFLADEIFAAKMLELSELGLKALLNSCEKKFKEDWNRFALESGAKMKGKFPFLGDHWTENCDVLRGLNNSQVTAGEFLELLGSERRTGKILEIYESYKDCLAKSETVSADDYGLRIGANRRRFFESCLDLRNFIFETAGKDQFHRIVFTLTIPGPNDPQIRLSDKSKFFDAYVRWASFMFSVNEDLEGGNEDAIIHHTRTEKFTGYWRFGDVNGSAGHYVLSDEKTRTVELGSFPDGLRRRESAWKQHAKNPAAPGDCSESNVDGIRLKFEAMGPWSLILFLKQYGTEEPMAQADGKQLWVIRYQYPSLINTKSSSERDRVIMPEVYFGLEIDRPLKPLPNWSEVEVE